MADLLLRERGSAVLLDASVTLAYMFHSLIKHVIVSEKSQKSKMLTTSHGFLSLQPRITVLVGA